MGKKNFEILITAGITPRSSPLTTKQQRSQRKLRRSGNKTNIQDLAGRNDKDRQEIIKNRMFENLSSGRDSYMTELKRY